MLVYTAFGILHNCSKATENKPIFTRHKFVTEAKPYIDAKTNHSEIVMNAIFTMSYVYEEHQRDLLRIPEPTAQQVVNTLRQAVKAGDHSHDGWHSDELAVAISNLSVQADNIRFFVQKGSIPILVAMLDFEEAYEVECALNAIWSLTTSSNKVEVSQTPNLMAKVERLAKSEEETVAQAAIRLKMKLEMHQQLCNCLHIFVFYYY